jgi:uncharacterized protein HemY
VSAVEKNYLRVAIVWVITLAILYTLQWYFTR